MATTVRQTYWPDGPLPLGLTHEELVNQGWLAYQAASRAKLARARWAMVDLIRDALSPVPGNLSRQGKTTCEAVSEDLICEHVYEEPRSPVRQNRLRRSDIQALRTACHRLFTPRSAKLAIQTLIDGESLDFVADQLGLTKQEAQVVRWRIHQRLLAISGRS
jgi:hypothetical protein